MNFLDLRKQPSSSPRDLVLAFIRQERDYYTSRGCPEIGCTVRHIVTMTELSDGAVGRALAQLDEDYEVLRCGGRPVSYRAMDPTNTEYLRTARRTRQYTQEAMF